jgi:hypothetical protein
MDELKTILGVVLILGKLWIGTNLSDVVKSGYIMVECHFPLGVLAKSI